MLLYRKRKQRVWAAAVKFLSMYESRVRQQVKTVNGEECNVWSWIDVSVVLSSTTSGQRILPKGRIAPELVTPAACESILTHCFRRDFLSPVDKSAAPCCCGICCLNSLMQNNPQSCPSHVGESGILIDGSLGPLSSPQHKQHLSRFCRVHSCAAQQTDIFSNRPHNYRLKNTGGLNNYLTLCVRGGLKIY